MFFQSIEYDTFGSRILDYFVNSGRGNADLSTMSWSPDKNLLICIFTNRSGSNFIGSSFAKHLSIEFKGECFDPDDIEAFCEAHSIHSFSDYIDHSGLFSGPGVIKLSSGQLRFLVSNGLLNSLSQEQIYSIAMINVSRNDKISQACSHYIAAATHEWWAPNNNEVLTVESPKIPPYSFSDTLGIYHEILAREINFDILANALGFNCQKVYYEDFIANPQNNLEETCKALKLAPTQDGTPPEVFQFRKQNKTANWIRLYSEIFKTELSQAWIF